MEVVPNCNDALLSLQPTDPLFPSTVAIGSWYEVENLVSMFNYDMVDDYSNYCGPIQMSLDPASAAGPASYDPLTDTLTLAPSASQVGPHSIRLILSLLGGEFADFVITVVVADCELSQFCFDSDSTASCPAPSTGDFTRSHEYVLAESPLPMTFE